MAFISGLMANCTACIGINHPKRSFLIGHDWSRLKYNDKVEHIARRISTRRHWYLFQGGSTAKYVPSVGRNHHELKFEDDYTPTPFWLPPFNDAFPALKSLFQFLAEQPSQLKYIEWPSFQSTLKTATLTLVLVALLIVALSSVDAALSFLLALVLRRTA